MWKGSRLKTSMKDHADDFVISKGAARQKEMKAQGFVQTGKALGNTPGNPSSGRNRKLLVAVTLVVTILIAAIVAFTSYLMGVQWRAATSTIKTASLAAAECIITAIHSDQYVLSNMAQHLSKYHDIEAPDLLLGMQEDTTYREIIAIFEDGAACSSLGAGRDEIDETVRLLHFMDGEHMSGPFYGRTGKRQVAYRADIVSGEEVTGVLYGIADLSQYYVPSVMEFYNEKGFSYVIDARDGDFLIYTTRTMSQGAFRNFYVALKESERPDAIEELKQVLLSGNTGSTVIDMLGQKTYLYFAPLDKGSTRYLITMVPYEVMRAESAGLVHIVVSFIAAILLTAVIVIVLNIRISRTKEQEREYREMLFQLLSENVDSVFFIYDAARRMLDYISENTQRILGASRDEFIGQNFFISNVMPDADRQMQISKALEEKHNFSLDYPYQNPQTGKQQLLRLSGYVPLEPYWQSKWIFCVDDRTEEVLKEQRLEQAVRDADKASLAKTEFLANMSHDIRTPMNGIIGMTQLALMDGTAPEKMRGYMQKVADSSTYLLSLINDILDMSKIESGKIELNPQPYSIKKLRVYLESVILPMCRDKEISFEADMDDTVCFLVDQQRFNQVLLNILSNAVKYTPRKGRVKFSLHVAATGPKEAHVSIVVADNGIGMTPEFQKKMFMPFAQESRKDAGMNGTGLGLAIVKNLVDLMDGTIRVESTVGVGTCFWIDMETRLLDAYEVDTASEDVDGTAESLAGAHVLLCEDNFLNQEIMVSILETVGISAEVADNGEQGLLLYLNHEPGHYAAILMDCRMPVMDGYEATRKIRAAKKPDSEHIPIVALTADAFEEDKTRCLEAGMNDFITKPIDIPKLVRVLMRAIGRT